MKKRVATISKLSLHDEAHHSFVFGLSGDELLKLMTSMTAQHYFDTHGRYPSRLDKTKISFRTIRDSDQ
jgi:hypothetical protein